MSDNVPKKTGKLTITFRSDSEDHLNLAFEFDDNCLDKQLMCDLFDQLFVKKFRLPVLQAYLVEFQKITN